MAGILSDLRNTVIAGFVLAFLSFLLYLMSGSYDLLVIVKQPTLHQVAAFVSERLSTIEGIVSTATHFLLRAYKEQGFLIEHPDEDKERLDVTP